MNEAQDYSDLVTVTIKAPVLDSKVATVAALLNELIKWAANQGVDGKQIHHIFEAFTKGETE